MPVTFSLVDVTRTPAGRRNASSPDGPRRPFACSNSGATRPYTAAMLYAFADRIDAARRGEHRIVDDDAAVAMDSGPHPWRCRHWGLMPMAMTTSCAGRIVPVGELHAADAPAFCRGFPRYGRPSRISCPARSFCRGRRFRNRAGAPRARPSGERPSPCTFFIRPLAASRPSRPPMTTALALPARQHPVDIGDVAEGHDAVEIAARHRKHDRQRNRWRSSRRS